METYFNISKAVLLTISAALAMSLLSAFVKVLGLGFPISEMIFFRFGLGLCYIILMVALSHIRGNGVVLRFKHWPSLLIRSLSGILAIYLLFGALVRMDLLDVTMLTTTYPLFVPILVLLLFQLYTPIKVWLAILVGFVGVVCILHPDESVFQYAALLALGSSLARAVAYVALGYLGKREHPYVILLTYFVIATLLTGILSLVHWQTPNEQQWLCLIAIAIFGVCYQETMTRAMVYAPSRVVAPLLYSSTIFSGAIGWIFWHEIPTLLTLLGVVLVCVGTIYVLAKSKPEIIMRKSNSGSVKK